MWRESSFSQSRVPLCRLSVAGLSKTMRVGCRFRRWYASYACVCFPNNIIQGILNGCSRFWTRVAAQMKGPTGCIAGLRSLQYIYNVCMYVCICTKAGWFPVLNGIFQISPRESQPCTMSSPFQDNHVLSRLHRILRQRFSLRIRMCIYVCVCVCVVLWIKIALCG